MVSLPQVGPCQECYLKVKCRRRWDRRGHNKNQALPVEESLVAAEREPVLLRKGGSYGVIRGGAKVRKRDIIPIGRMMPPQFKTVSLSLIVSQSTEKTGL
jgi:hypothetical protein